MMARRLPVPLATHPGVFSNAVPGTIPSIFQLLVFFSLEPFLHPPPAARSFFLSSIFFTLFDFFYYYHESSVLC